MVAQPKSLKDYCVSVRLDTAHLTEEDVLDYEVKSDIWEPDGVSASIPSEEEANKVFTHNEYKEVYHPTVIPPVPIPVDVYIGDAIYKCYKQEVKANRTYTSPWADYDITGAIIAATNYQNGNGELAFGPQNKSLIATLSAWASGCFLGGGVPCADCRDKINSAVGSASMKVHVDFRSKEKIKKVGTEEVVLITTRGLCCCASGTSPGRHFPIIPRGIIKIERIRDLIRRVPSRTVDPEVLYKWFVTPVAIPGREEEPMINASTSEPRETESSEPQSTPRCGKLRTPVIGAPHFSQTPSLAAKTIRKAGGMPPQVANGLSDLIINELRSTVGESRGGNPQPYVYTEHFIKKLRSRMHLHHNGRQYLKEPSRVLRSQPGSQALRAVFDKTIEEITNRDLSSVASHQLAKFMNISETDAIRLRLATLGIKFKNCGFG